MITVRDMGIPNDLDQPYTLTDKMMLDDQLLKLVTLAKLDGPASSDVRFLRDWFERGDMGCFPIWGLDKKSWDDEDDLIAIKPRLLQDPVSRFHEASISMFHRFLGEKLKVRDKHYRIDGIRTKVVY